MQVMSLWRGWTPPFVWDGKYTCICDLHSTYLLWRQKALDKLSKSCASLSLLSKRLEESATSTIRLGRLCEVMSSTPRNELILVEQE